MRERLPRMFPSASFAFLPADMVSQILNFGVPAPIDLQIVGSDVQGEPEIRQRAAGADQADSRIADARIQQAFQQRP